MAQRLIDVECLAYRFAANEHPVPLLGFNDLFYFFFQHRSCTLREWLCREDFTKTIVEILVELGRCSTREIWLRVHAGIIA